ncbi:hypothetical protein EVAR_46225_1 [Eumeta japonica]|uniref:Uncharacterized protein n=1 Tax=Eumeta variegata TaxID=151549 RepID=A0A4C1XKZ5_EUMVA|nr:hypothetical protein EVAR_46225_1 [Eumeta japonica]
MDGQRDGTNPKPAAYKHLEKVVCGGFNCVEWPRTQEFSTRAPHPGDVDSSPIQLLSSNKYPGPSGKVSMKLRRQFGVEEYFVERRAASAHTGAHCTLNNTADSDGRLVLKCGTSDSFDRKPIAVSCAAHAQDVRRKQMGMLLRQAFVTPPRSHIIPQAVYFKSTDSDLKLFAQTQSELEVAKDNCHHRNDDV